MKSWSFGISGSIFWDSVKTDKGCESINLTSFRFYDRMYPSQDSAQSLGNLVALPLQGRALKAGNSAFVDKAWNAYPDQLEALDRIRRLTAEDVEQYILRWETERLGRPASSAYLHGQERLKPWKRNDAFHPEDVAGTLHIVLADGVYVDALNLLPRLQNQIRCLATIDNPEFYRRKNSGNSTYYYLSTIYLGRDVEGYIVRFGDPSDVRLLIDELRKAGVSVSLTDSESEHFAVIDKKLVWHGGMNLLGKEDAWDNLIRVESVQAAAELLEMAKLQTERDAV